MPASKVRKVRGNTFLYMKFPGESGPFAATDRVAEVKTGGLQVNQGEIDVTNWDSGDWKDFIMDVLDGTIPIITNLIVDSPQLPKIIAASKSGGVCNFLFVMGDVPAANAKNFCSYGNCRLKLGGFDTSDTHQLKFDVRVAGEPAMLPSVAAFPTVV